MKILSFSPSFGLFCFILLLAFVVTFMHTTILPTLSQFSRRTFCKTLHPHFTSTRSEFSTPSPMRQTRPSLRIALILTLTFVTLTQAKKERTPEEEAERRERKRRKKEKRKKRRERRARRERKKRGGDEE